MLDQLDALNREEAAERTRRRGGGGGSGSGSSSNNGSDSGGADGAIATATESNTPGANSRQDFHLRRLVVLCALGLVGGSVAFAVLEGWGLVDSIYFCTCAYGLCGW